MQPVAPGTWQPFGAPACEQLIFEAELDAGFAIGVGAVDGIDGLIGRQVGDERSEEHTSELQSLMRISYAVFCLKQKIIHVNIACTRSNHKRTYLHRIKLNSNIHIKMI